WTRGELLELSLHTRRGRTHIAMPNRTPLVQTQPARQSRHVAAYAGSHIGVCSYSPHLSSPERRPSRHRPVKRLNLRRPPILQRNSIATRSSTISTPSSLGIATSRRKSN